MATRPATTTANRERQVARAVERTVAAGCAPLAYLPVVRLTDQAVVGAEALLRLHDATGHPIPAHEVIEVAERIGADVALGRAVLRSACLQGAAWVAAVPERDCIVSVNLSTRQLADPNLPAIVDEELRATRLDPARLVLEVTEDALAQGLQAVEWLARLKTRGVQLLLDDFGTGQASLAQLARVPVDGVKLDMSFVTDLPRHEGAAAIVRAMVGMADALGLETVAEGVETSEQLAALRAIGCGSGQGFLWSRAVAGEAVASLVAGATSLVRPVAPDRSVPEPVTPSRWADDAALAVLVHEVRSPLTAVIGFASLLEDSVEPDAPEADAVRRILRSAHGIERILRTTEDVARIDDGSLRVVTGPTDLADVVGRLVDDLRATTSVPLALEAAAPGGPTALVDRGRVEQILVNLVSNAAKFSPVDGVVTVAVAQGAEWVDVDVSDQGPGIAPDQVGLVFRKYGRADRSGPGTGLGLYLARGVARAHGGDVRYHRRPEGGSTFTLRLPVGGPQA